MTLGEDILDFVGVDNKDLPLRGSLGDSTLTYTMTTIMTTLFVLTLVMVVVYYVVRAKTSRHWRYSYMILLALAGDLLMVLVTLIPIFSAIFQGLDGEDSIQGKSPPSSNNFYENVFWVFDSNEATAAIFRYPWFWGAMLAFFLKFRTLCVWEALLLLHFAVPSMVTMLFTSSMTEASVTIASIYTIVVHTVILCYYVGRSRYANVLWVRSSYMYYGLAVSMSRSMPVPQFEH